LAREAPASLVVGKLDCTEFAFYCTQAAIAGYPTIKLITPDTTIEYTGERSAIAIQSWYARSFGVHVDEPVEVVTLHESTLGPFVERASAAKRKVLLCLVANWCSWCKQLKASLPVIGVVVAKAGADVVVVDAAAEPAVARTYGVTGYPHIVLLLPGGARIVYEGERTASALATFVQSSPQSSS
jgi:thiol-disulfide isomerase/thioredoxin